MAASIYGIGVSALNIAQAGVATVGHNIANANTAGYSRQIVEQNANAPFFNGSGYFGTGASIKDIQRVYDGFLADQVRQANSDAASLSTYHTQMTQIANLLGDPNAGLAPALSAFFSSVQTVSAQPGDSSARQAMLSNAQALAARFRSFDSQLQDLRDAANRSIQSSATRINSYAQQIAALNERISRLVGTGANNQQPNDLLDQRDALVADLSKEIGVTTLEPGDGSCSVFLSSGQPIVLGNNVSLLKAGRDVEDGSDLQLTISVGTGQMRIRPEDMSGGKLGGYLNFRREGVTDAQNALGRIAMAVAATVNAQHQLGVDLNGNLGSDLFTSGAPTVIANTGNVGTASISATVSDLSSVAASDYRMVYDGANYTLTRLTDGTVTNFATLPQTVDGLTLDLGSGAPSAGDRFLIQPTRSGARNFNVALTDVRAIAAAAPVLAGTSSGNTGTGAVSGIAVDAPPPADANLRQMVTITFTGAGTFNVSGTGTGNPTGVAYTPGGDISYNGWTLQIAGQPKAGDVFTVKANTTGTGDNRNARLIAALQTQTLVGGTNFTGAYGQLVSQIGNKTNELQITSEAQANIAATAQTAQNSASGVNLDEEASNLIRYQQAYQAAGKMISVANTLFDTILNLRS